MSWLLHLHPLRLFSFYLMFVFIVTTLLNLRDYRNLVGLARSLPGRWPRLLELIKQHSHIFITWRMAAPVLASLGLLLVQLSVTRVVAPAADGFLTGEHLLQIWPVLPVVFLTGAVMVAFDIYANWLADPIDRAGVEKQFDQAEFWLKSWTAPVVHLLSFGRVNPRQMVALEVRQALVSASDLLHRTLWWTAGQAVFRITFGLTLWLTYALYPWLYQLLHTE